MLEKKRRKINKSTKSSITKPVKFASH